MWRVQPNQPLTNSRNLVPLKINTPTLFVPLLSQIKTMRSPIFTFILLLSLAPLAQAAQRPPNVIYIMSDELGYFEPGFMGGQHIQTPHLDRMAAEGIRFTNLFAGSSVCAPTRCCFLTGKHS
ncbi:MAG: sulfatase-like hydrolase/transferase, partial [Planctomycetaceae bacterium]|nr:sulfatase-like hydrolase/transferase [Planctomycetaceae bacterium]